MQTKFTSLDGQDTKQPLPYDKTAEIEDQVAQSVETSRKNLRLETIDSLVLHGPIQGDFDLTLKAWRAMERAVDEGKVRYYSWA